MERSFSIKRLQVWVWVLGGLFGTARASLILYSRWVNSVFFARLVALPRPLRAPLLWHHTDGQCCKARRADLASEASRKLGEKPSETCVPRNMWVSFGLALVAIVYTTAGVPIANRKLRM